MVATTGDKLQLTGTGDRRCFWWQRLSERRIDESSLPVTFWWCPGQVRRLAVMRGWGCCLVLPAVSTAGFLQPRQ